MQDDVYTKNGILGKYIEDSFNIYKCEVLQIRLNSAQVNLFM